MSIFREYTCQLLVDPDTYTADIVKELGSDSTELKSISSRVVTPKRECRGILRRRLMSNFCGETSPFVEFGALQDDMG